MRHDPQPGPRPASPAGNRDRLSGDQPQRQPGQQTGASWPTIGGEASGQTGRPLADAEVA
jgi:hypothetical protein